MDGRAAQARRLRLGGDRTRVAIIAAVALFLGFYWFNLVQELGKAEDDAVQAARHRAQLAAQAAGEAVDTTLSRFRVTLTAAAIAAAQGPGALRLYGDAISAGADDLVRQLYRVDANGMVVYSSNGRAALAYVGERGYFKDLAADPALPLVLSVPMLERPDGVWSLQVARPVAVHGRFSGLVALSVNPERWTEQLAQFELNGDDVLTLFSADGTYLLRSREGEAYYGQKVAANRPFLHPDSAVTGSYVEPGTRDGIVRVFAWKRLPSGLVMACGIGLDQALAPVRAVNRKALERAGVASGALILALLVLTLASRHSDRASRKVAEQEYMQRVTLSAMAEGLAVVQHDGSITFHNDSFARIVPYDEERLSRRGGFTSWNVVDAAGHPLAFENYPSVLSARTGRAVDNLVLGLRDDRGGTRWLNVNARPLQGTDGRPHASILTLTDITSQRDAERALKASEERYRALVDSLMEGIVVQGREGQVIASNPAADRILGAGRAESLVGRGLDGRHLRVQHADGSEFDAADYPIMVALRTGERCDGVVMGLERSDGTVVWIEINTAPLSTTDSGAVEAVVSSFLDITHRKEFEDELSRSNAELEQFAYAVSHDLREPLRMVASYIQLLERRLGAAASDEIREFVGFAVDGAKRMDRMLVALLEYSRVGRRGQPMEWVDSRRVLDEALLFLSPVVQQTGAEVLVEGEWPMLFASPDELERLFQNLLGNALKYHADGVKPVIRVEAARGAGVWRFSFADNGIGIAPDQTGRLFKVFQRLHGAGRYEGSGVGLALCRRIVQRHEGRIWVESEGAGTGSTFIFTLPVSAVQIPVEEVA